jgi:hypothetical protein
MYTLCQQQIIDGDDAVYRLLDVTGAYRSEIEL